MGENLYRFGQTLGYGMFKLLTPLRQSIC